MNRKLTIGIDVDSHVAKMLGKQVTQWKDLPLRLHDPESYHIPLVTLGWVHEDLVPDIIMGMHAVVAEREMMNLELTEIAPICKVPSQVCDVRDARVLWCRGEPSEVLRDLYSEILEALDMGDAPAKSFAPHIVLGQMRREKWQALEHHPEMHVPMAMTLDVSHLTLFEHTTEEDKKVFLPFETFDLQ